MLAGILIAACAMLAPTMALAGPATHFSVSAPAAATAGTAFNFTVTALDASNAVATGYAGTLRFTSTDGAATLPAHYTFGAADAGEHTFSATLETVGARTITVTDTITSSIVGTSNAIADGIGPPTVGTLFLPDSISANRATLLSFTLKNPNANARLTGVSFTDALPSGLVVASPNALSSSCGGTVAATPGSGTVSLTGGAIGLRQNDDGGACFISVEVTAASPAAYVNKTGAISAIESGPGVASNTAILTVKSSSASASPPTISKVFVPSSISPGDRTLLGFTLTNPNAVDLTDVTFTDQLPSGLSVANPSGLSNSCGGTVAAPAGSSSIALTGGMVSAVSPLADVTGGGCFISVEVTAAAAGTFSNTTGAISANESGAGAASKTAVLTVTSPLPPTISISFDAGSIHVGGSTALTFLISNPNSEALTGLAFTDSLPAGLVVATPNALVNACGGTVMAVPGSTSISLAGGTAQATESGLACSISLLVRGTTVGTTRNTTGAITSARTGPGSPSNTAILAVIPIPPPTGLSVTPR